MKLVSINNTFQSYQELIKLYESNRDKMFSVLRFELHDFFAANMSAVLGAIFDKLAAGPNEIHIDYLSPPIETILSKNDFLTYFGKPRMLDTYMTTIKYQKLRPTDGKYFKTYVIDELIDGYDSSLPKMSQGVKGKMVEAIYEVFVNAQIHSEAEHIYTCGQFFPSKNEIEFTVVDTGIGFRERINRTFGSNITSTQAIEWALRDQKTTKKGVSGGLGLTILKEFIVANKGMMQIISNDGFYQYDCRGKSLGKFRGEFPGTIVNLQFKTDDKGNYSLKSAIDINNIF